jgi:hypothetical protein
VQMRRRSNLCLLMILNLFWDKMTLELYKITIKNCNDKYPRLRAGELSKALIVDLAKAFKIDINADHFMQLNLINKDWLENFAKKVDLQGVLRNNGSILQNICKELPITEIISQKTFTKIDWCFMIYVTFSDSMLSSALTKRLSPKIQVLWDAMIWSPAFTAAQVQEITGVYPLRNLGKANAYSSKEIIEVLEEYKAFATEYSDYYSSSTFTFSLPTMVRAMQKPYTEAPKDSTLNPLDTLPEQSLSIYESENLALQDIGRILAYQSQGNIKTLTSGKASASTSNKMRKALSLEEFYSDDNYLEALRSYFLANFIQYIPLKEVSVGTPQVEILKNVFARYKANKIAVASIVVTHLKGINKIDSNYNLTKNEDFLSAFKHTAVGKWYTAKNLEKYYFYQEKDYSPISKDMAAYYLTYEKAQERYIEAAPVKGDNYQKMVTENHVKGSLFMLASLGIFDLAYTQPDTTTFGESFFSDFDGLYAFRLTPLGAYLMGKSQHYEAPISEDSTTLFFDENELIILGKAEDKLTDTLLLNYVQKAGANRYIATAQSFLKDCKNPKQLKDKIALFKQTIGKSKLPDNWETFFETLNNRATHVTMVSDSYEIFQLNPEDKDLIRLIAQDKDFQKIVLKVEGFKVLLAKDKVASFRSKLREYGYLLK